jgi:phosphate:Na+ symporter
LLSPVPVNVEQHVATAHTIYNALTGLAFLFFPGALLRPLDKLLPKRGGASDEVKPFLLDRNLIQVPALALRQVTEEVIYLTEICRKTVAEAFDSFRYHDLDLSEQVVRREEVISSIHREVSQYLIDVCEQPLSRRDASHLEILQTAVGSLSRIGELGERLRDLTARKIEEGVKGTEEMDRDLGEVYDLVMAQFANILSLLRQRDTKTEENAVKMVERIAKFSSRIEAQWRQRIEQSETPAKPLTIHLQTVIYQEGFGILFRIASQLAHIAARMRILSPERF